MNTRRPTLRRAIAMLLIACLLPAATATSLAGCGDDTQASKTEIALRLGLAYGSFKRYIYTPAQEGQFKAGVDGRKRAIAKAAVAGAFSARMLQKAKEEADQDPQFAAFGQKIVAAGASFAALNTLLKGGEIDTSAITGGLGSLDSLTGAAKDLGIDVVPKEPSAKDLLTGG